MKDVVFVTLKLEEGCHRKGSLRLGINGRRHTGDQTAKQRSSGTQLESRRNSITAERGPDSRHISLKDMVINEKPAFSPMTGRNSR